MQTVDRAAQRTEENRLLRKLRDDFLYYAERVLKIKDKAGKLVPLKLNREQLYVLNRFIKQLQETGKIRAIVVKPRQRGISTLIAALFYWWTSMRRGRGAFVLSHRDDTTQSLFDMVERYYDNDQIIHPHVDRSNAKQMRFDLMDSNFRVGTAGAKAVGHGFTVQLFHGSEAAYWANPEAHMEGIGQSIPSAPDTVIILESTGNGRGTWFHGICRDAEKGIGDYQIIFFPWFWAEDYTTPLPPDGFDFSVEDLEYQDLHQITDAQLYWRRLKIDSPDFRGDELAFQQAYPATLAEAFITREGSFIPSLAIARARKTTVEAPVGPLVIGVDPTAYGKDRFAITGRVGRKQVFKEAHHNWGAKEGARRLAEIITDGVFVEGRGKMKPAKIFVDKVGVGAATLAMLDVLGYSHLVIGIHGQEKVMDPERHFNKKAEMWDSMKTWIEDEPCDLVDDDDLEADLTAPKYQHDISGQRLKIEAKESLRARKVASPDNAEALSLTFAYPVSETLDNTNERGHHTAPRKIRRRGRVWQAR